jgi:hypothetical protein
MHDRAVSSIRDLLPLLEKPSQSIRSVGVLPGIDLTAVNA